MLDSPTELYDWAHIILIKERQRVSRRRLLFSLVNNNFIIDAAQPDIQDASRDSRPDFYTKNYEPHSKKLKIGLAIAKGPA